MMTVQRFLSTVLGAAAIALAGTSASAVLVVNDTWQDGTRSDPASPTYSEHGVDGDVDGDLESAWFAGGSGTLDPVGPGGPLRGSGFGTSSATWTTYFTAEGNELNLANTGDKIVVTWVFTPTTVSTDGNTSQNFRIALVDSPAASRVDNENSPGSSTYTGYGIFANMGTTLNRNDAFELVERSAPAVSSALLSSSSSWEDDFLAAADGGNGNPGYSNGTEYTFVFTIERVGGGLLDVTATISGTGLNGTGSMTASASGVAANGSSYLFDTFSIRPTNEATTAAQFDTSLFRVEFIPEPASLALLGAGGLALIARRRRA